MNIQRYILPEWKKGVISSSLPNGLQDRYVRVGKSMAEFLDRQMMRELPDSWYKGWVRYHFPLNTDPREIQLHQIIAMNFASFVSENKKYEDFSVSQDDLTSIQEIENLITLDKSLQNEWFTRIKTEVNEIRGAKSNGRSERRKKKPMVIERAGPKKKENHEVSQEILEREFVYQKWMEEVNSKPISKSYWHIHEYMARFILDFAEKHNEIGRVTADIVEEFLVEYGKGKRPKTMNHYNRVARYFRDFYLGLEKEEGFA